MDDCSVEITTAAAAAATAADMPQHWYHKRLKAFLDPNLNGCKVLNKKGVPEPDYTATQILRGLESSLRTKCDGWVGNFLLTDAEKSGLVALVQFLAFRLLASTKESNSISSGNISSVRWARAFTCEEPDEGEGELPSSPALNAIALSIAHPSVVHRAKSLALDLLATTCLVDGGTHHQLVLAAFDHVQRKLGERRRFQSLVHLFTTVAPFDRRLSVAYMNLRVYLQVEFRMIGLDEAYLRERLSGGCNSADLQGHIQTYLDNIIDVGALLG
ncbi:Formin-like protein 2 [Tyrophagus putrescentiae]|nr:Formin-like protein 2 [Tyrophagus putrescentiae]